MLREHRWSYAGLGLVLTAAAAVVGSSLVLRSSAHRTTPDASGLTPNESAKLKILSESGQTASLFIAVLGGFVAIFIVMQTMSFVVDSRQTELARLRLAGGSSSQVTSLILCECALLGLLASTIGSFAGLLWANPYAEILAAQNNWPPGVAVELHLTPVFWSIAIMTAVTTLGAWFAAFRIGRTAAVDAVKRSPTTRCPMPRVRWILAAVGFVVTVLFAVLPSEWIDYRLSAAAVGAGAVLMTSAMAPVIVPAVARVLGALVSPFAPGAALVAREHAVYDARRTAALATPIIILLGIGTVFGSLAQTGRAESAQGLTELTKTDVVVEADNIVAGSYSSVDSLPEVAGFTRIRHTENWSWAEANILPGEVLDIMAIQPENFADFVPVNFESGGIDDIHENNVAALSSSASVGDVLEIEASDGSKTRLRVAATVEPTRFVYGSILLDESSLNLDEAPSEDIWLLSAAHGVSQERLVRAVEGVVPDALVLCWQEWVDRSISEDVKSQRSAILTIVGGASILALISLGQSTIAAVRERRAELALLAKTGAGRGSLIGTVVIESVITTITAVILGTAIATAVYFRMETSLAAVNDELSPMVPFGILGLVLSACALTNIGSAAISSIFTTRRISSK